MKTLLFLLFSFSLTANETILVNDRAMEPLIKKGSRLNLVNSPIKNGDFVAFEWNEKRYVRKVYATGGDRFEMVKKNQCYQVLINKKVVKNSKGIPFCSDRRMLEFYSKSYFKHIPTDHLIMLSEDPKGKNDSTNIGVVYIKHLIGKVTR